MHVPASRATHPARLAHDRTPCRPHATGRNASVMARPTHSPEEPRNGTTLTLTNNLRHRRHNRLEVRSTPRRRKWQEALTSGAWSGVCPGIRSEVSQMPLPRRRLTLGSAPCRRRNGGAARCRASPPPVRAPKRNSLLTVRGERPDVHPVEHDSTRRRRRCKRASRSATFVPGQLSRFGVICADLVVIRRSDRRGLMLRAATPTVNSTSAVLMLLNRVSGWAKKVRLPVWSA